MVKLQIFFIFTPIWGRFSPILTSAYFSDGLVVSTTAATWYFEIAEQKICDQKATNVQLGGETSNIRYFHSDTWENHPIFANIYPMGWFNHQLAKVLEANRFFGQKQHWDVGGGFQPLSSPKLFFDLSGLTHSKNWKRGIWVRRCMYTIYIWYSINICIN